MINFDPSKVNSLIQEVAAKEIIPHFRCLKEGEVAFKIGDDPVTIADKEAEKALSARLLDLLPGSKVVGEEAFSQNPCISESFFDESPVWIIDPVDGTRNFVSGSSDFGVIVALTKRNQTIAGWIYHPTSGEMITAEKGGGAWFKEQKLQVLPPMGIISSRGILNWTLGEAYKKYNQNKEVGPFLYACGASSHEYPLLLLDQPHFGKDIPQHHFRVRNDHSTPWDDAAAVLMHREAGGFSAYLNGEPYRPSKMNLGLALTPDRESWEQLREWLVPFIPIPGRKLAA